MSDSTGPSNAAILTQANAAITLGDIDGFLAYCDDNIIWSTVGGETLRGKSAVREWMKDAYAQPPQFTVEEMAEDGELVIALGEISAPNEAGETVQNSYCDVWRVRGGKLTELRAFVIPI